MTRLVVFFLFLIASASRADDVHVAVAANFAAPLQALGEAFTRQSGHRVQASAGSTGKFYAQIRNGAPFDVLLSADDETPRRLEEEKAAVAGTRFTYALGRLVLWSAVESLVDDRGEVLRTARFRKLAVANPRLAPYGAAAQQAMTKLGVWGALQGRLVQGENIAQTFQFVASGNADLGFVALAQLAGERKGSRWLVPAELHAPIRQDAVLLARAASNQAARALLDYLRGAAARERIRAYGYELP
ncbi:MAG: molybdate ABC transporter substrate-binding protein [Betaproteobacteria bacterium]